MKSAVLNYLNGCEMKQIEVNRADVAASFQQAVVDVLVERGIRAAKQLEKTVLQLPEVLRLILPFEQQ